MRVEILHIADCANWEETGILLRAALDNAGMAAEPVEFRLLRSSAEAAAVPFAGSPTILLDGVDAFPGGDRSTDLACRVYRTEQGFAGAPSLEQLAEAIRVHSQP